MIYILKGGVCLKVALIYLSNYKDWPMGGMLNYINNIIPTLCDSEKMEVDIWGGTRGKERAGNFYIGNREFILNRYTSFYTEHKILPNFVLSFFGALLNSFKFRKYDVIYSQTSATTIALKITHPFKKVIHHQHGFSYKDRPGIPRKMLCFGHLIAQKLADATLFVASDKEVNEHRKQHRCLKNKHFYTIGSPINYKYIHDRMLNIKTKKTNVTRFVYTGRIDEWKNIELMIEAFDLFMKSGYEGELTIIGDGPLLEKIKHKVDGLQCCDNICITGRKDFNEIVEYLCRSDVFLFPTKGEGVSLSLLEAFSAGLPAIVFNVKGVTEFVKDEISGVIVEKMTICDYMNGMIKISMLYENMRDNCIEIASRYESDIIANKIIDIILKEFS